MPLRALHALHFEASCDHCGTRSRLVCTHELPTARRDAVKLFTEEGWSHVVDTKEPAHAWMEREGAGRWVCAVCSRDERARDKLGA